ncbi:MAG: VWA domain-containing protein [Verrucomicrobiota bacterium]
MDDNSLHFAQPLWMIAGLVACAGVIALYVRFDRRRDADLAKLIHPRFRQRLTEGFSPRLRNLKRALWLLAVFAAFVAVARPQKGYEWREVKRKGIDILFAVDTSRSMLAEDLTPNRLERARLGILDFVAKLEGDRVGLIPFAGSAFALCPLTLDYEAFRESLNALDTDLIPKQGTDLASAIKEAERLFDENGNNHRVLVLMTDGEDLQGSVIDAAKDAAKKGMAIYTVGVGSPEGATIPVQAQYGRIDVVRDENGNPVHTKLDESTLKQIAEVTGALYVPLGRGAEGLNTIYQEKLRLVPKSDMNQRMQRIPLERFEWPLGAAIGLLLLEFFIGDRRRVKKARALPSVARRTKIAPQSTAVMLLGILAFGTADSRAAEAVSSSQDPRKTYNQGTEAYAKGDFAKASESLKASLRTQDLALQQRSYYNLGNTLYRTGQGTLEKDPEATIKTWEESIKAYQDALSLNDADEDAKYNKALVEKKLEELKKQQNKDDKKDDQKKDDQSKEDQEKKDDKDQKDSKDSKDQKENQDSKNEKDGKESKPDEKSEDGKQPKDEKDSKDSKEEGKPEDQQDKKDGKDPKDSQEKKDGKESKDGKKPEDGKPQEAGDEKQDAAKPGEEKEGTASEERVQKQEMTPEEAKQLLEALRQDERTVIPIPPQRRSRFTTPDNSTKGKTW